jgi:pyruvate/2-oxoglutarate dehydrogenase complex dihydrolipoamide dehydrogenase (E3) component
MKKYDAVIIGSGQGGNPLAVKLAISGRKTALVEREHIGGSCINVGCTPTKTMEASARVAHLVRRANDYGVHFNGMAQVDMERVRQKKRDIVTSFSGGDRAKLERKGVDLIMGEARFTGPKQIEVALNDGGTRRITGDKIFIDTGTRPAIPKIEGLKNCAILNNESIMELDTLPEHLLVIGGGYVGVEFARMFQRFGSQVTIIHSCDHLLCREDEDVAEVIQDIFRKDGIRLVLNAETTRARQDGDGSIHLTVRSGDGEEVISGSHLLVSTGRTPNTDMLNLQTAGVETDDLGFIRADEKLRTSAPDIFVMGDVKGGPAFTHIAYDDYRVIKSNLFEGSDATISDRILPYVVFIDPQLGRVGLTEKEALEKGLSFKVVKMPMTHVARALETDESQGFLKALVDTNTGQILGFAALSVEGGELMAVVQMAMMGGLTYKTLRSSIFAHPTLAESLNNLFGLVDRV